LLCVNKSFLLTYLLICYTLSGVVGRSIGHVRELYKNGWTDRDAVWRTDPCRSKEPCILWGQGRTNPLAGCEGWQDSDAYFRQNSLTTKSIWRNNCQFTDSDRRTCGLIADRNCEPGQSADTKRTRLMDRNACYSLCEHSLSLYRLLTASADDAELVRCEKCGLLNVYTSFAVNKREP